MGLPAGRSAGARLCQHLVDLLERETFGLGHEEVREEDRERGGRTPDEEHLGAEVGLVGGHKVGGNDTDDAIPEPVGGGGHADTTRPNGQREHLTDNDPGCGAPCGCECDNVQANERDLSLDSGGVPADLLGVGRGDTDDGNDELAHNHAGTTDEQDATATETLDDPERERGREHVDERRDESNQERVVDGPQSLEERGSKVEDEVDTGELLRALEPSADERATDVRGAVEE